MNREPRYTRTESERDMRDALATRIETRVHVIERYVAVGSATARIPIPASRLPYAVQLVDARLYFDQGGPLALTPSLSFVWDSASKTAQVYEPGGLASNTAYRLTYQVIGG